VRNNRPLVTSSASDNFSSSRRIATFTWEMARSRPRINTSALFPRNHILSTPEVMRVLTGNPLPTVLLALMLLPGHNGLAQGESGRRAVASHVRVIKKMERLYDGRAADLQENPGHSVCGFCYAGCGALLLR